MRVRDVCRLFDARAIQMYVINGARVVFLNERPHPRGKRAESGEKKAPSNARGENTRRSSCRRCSRTLQSDTSRFCSIACKAGVAGAEMAPSEEAAREAEAESAGDGGAGDKGDKKETSLTRNLQKMTKKRGREEARADGNETLGNGTEKLSGSPRTPSVLGSARAKSARDGNAHSQKSRSRAGLGSNESFGAGETSRGARRNAARAGSRRSLSSSLSPTETRVRVPNGGSGSHARTPEVSRSRAKRETGELSPLGFPDLEASPGSLSGEARDAENLARKEAPESGEFRGRKKEQTPAKVKKETLKEARSLAEKPPAAVSNSRRKNRPKRSPDA